MKQKILLSLIAFISLVVLSSHDLYIKLKSFYLEPNTKTLIYVYNGTFGKSEAILARDRMIDVSLINPGEKAVHPDKSLWFEKNNQTVLKITTGKVGTGVLGISTLPRINEFTAESFASNMKHEGLLDVLVEREKSGEDSKPARKKYSKHVKAIFQVGNKQTDDYKTVLGYPIEFIPMSNPYALKIGDELAMKLLIDGEPVAGEMVYASYNDQYGHEKDGTPRDAYKVLTNSDGIVTVKIVTSGHWYFRTVNLGKSTLKDADYVSISAALTFEVKE
ncbi:hypothetical protein MNBD_BACTEROID02-1481 [hydrothermal vent metagenome]|uniref:Nikel transport family protein NikM n=1 Tax=hydrothermal vent metagenome TaxID=652676 RepID=A0A3B0QU63_9ZZZZ